MRDDLRTCPSCESPELVIGGVNSRMVRCIPCGAAGPKATIVGHYGRRSILSAEQRAAAAWNSLPRREDLNALREQVRELAGALRDIGGSGHSTLCDEDLLRRSSSLSMTHVCKCHVSVARAALAKLEGGES